MIFVYTFATKLKIRHTINSYEVYNHRRKVKKIVSQTLNDYFKFEDSRLDEMARVGFIEGQRYVIFVRTNDEGFILHIHIMDQATNGRELDCCVKLEINEYFSHGKHQDILNSKLCKALNDFMHQPCRSPKYSNNMVFFFVLNYYLYIYNKCFI